MKRILFWIPLWACCVLAHPAVAAPESPTKAVTQESPREEGGDLGQEGGDRDPVTKAGYRYPGRTFGVWDYLGTAVAAGAFLTLQFLLDPHDSVNWTWNVPLDDAVQSFVGAKTSRGQQAADDASDFLWYTSMAYPVIAAIVYPTVRGGRSKAPFQMTMINLQAYAISGSLVRIPQVFFGRYRPHFNHCLDDPEQSAGCASVSSRQSFPSGHTQMSMTAAGLSCAHHLHGDLSGSPLADVLACTLALSAGTAVGFLRIRADRHFHSDTVFGMLAGFGVGYGVPTLLYYQPFRKKRPGDRQTSGSAQPKTVIVRWSVLPEVHERGVGLSVLASGW